MSRGLPASVDLIRLANQGARLTGRLPLKRMQRLTAICCSGEGGVAVDLQFSRDAAAGFRRLQGTITAELEMTCERCLEDMGLKTETHADFLLVTPDQAILVDDEEVLVSDGAVSLSDLVENEVLLALPMIPMHSLEECPATGDFHPLAAGGGKQDKPNPFAGLAKLKRPDPESSH